MFPQTFVLGRCVPWTMCPLDDAFPGRCVPLTTRPMDDATLERCDPWTMRPWRMRPLDDAPVGNASLGRYVRPSDAGTPDPVSVHPAYAPGFRVMAFFVLYSALLLLPPLIFHCAVGCWDRTQDRCNLCIGSQTL
jgi:hypothetical protein